MNTDTLIQLLSREPIEKRGIPFGLRLMGSVCIAALFSLSYVVFHLGVQPDLLDKMMGVAFWVKFGFALSLLLVGLIIALKAGKPGKATSNYALPIASPVIAIWVVALWVLSQPSTSSLSEMVEGSSWKVCSMRIASLSVPMFAAVFWSLKHMAPTRPRLAGFTAGLFAGGLAACIYALFCGEYSPVFIGIWYLLGIMTPAIVGGVLGKWLLKW